MARRESFRLILVLSVALSVALSSRADDWPQWMGPNRDGVWREDGILSKFPPGGPAVVWRKPIGAGFSGPAIAGDRVFVMDRKGDQPAKGREGSGKDGLKGTERVLCLDAATGDVIWVHEYDCLYRINVPNGPRTTPTVHDGKVYILGAMGDLRCLDATSGTLSWEKNLLREYKADYPIWGYSSHPLVDGKKLICLVGGEGSAAVAFDRDTGKEIWRALTVREIGYAPPMIVEAGGTRQLIIWHTEAISGLDPETGHVYWSVTFPQGDVQRPGITTATPRLDGNRLFVSSPHHGSLMLELAADKPAAKVLWQGKSDNLAKPDGLHVLMMSPVLRDGYVYGVCNFGELRCLKADTGERVWEHSTTGGKKTLGASSFLVPNGDHWFVFNDQGELIISRLSPTGYQEIDRAKIIDPTLFSRGREVVWSHPAFAHRRVFVRNDKEIVCVSLAAAGT